MKNSIYLLCLVTFLFAACSGNDDTTIPEEEEGSNFVIVDYNPKESYTAEEVTIQTEGIDATATIEVYFSGVQAAILETGTNIIKTRVPSGANSGELTVIYNSEEISVGAIGITEETDVVYGEKSNNGENNSVYTINLGDATTGELIYTAAGYDQVGRVSFSKESNTFFNGYSVQCGQTGGCSTSFVLKNRDNELSKSISICTDLDCNESIRIKTFSTGKFIYEFFRDDLFFGELEHRLVSVDLYTMQSTTLRDYVVQGESNITAGVYLDSTNEILSFDNEKLIKFNLNNFTKAEYDYPGISLGSFIRTQSGRIFALNNLNAIVEINPMNGEIIEEIYTNAGNLNYLSYSESTGRFFWLADANGSSELHIYNPSNQIETIINTQDSFYKIFTDY